MLRIKYHIRFKKDLKLAKKRGLDIKKLMSVVEVLANEGLLDEKYKDHALSGNYSGFRECHIQPDWLLIYETDSDELTLGLLRTGTHSDLF